MPKISIIVPIYNVEQYLCRCIDSILNQTFNDFECILVDDGSPDRCGDICDEYAKKDKRIRVIHKPNGGLSDARNAGIDAAKGEYLGFVDSDDWIHPQMYEILYKGIVENNVKLSVCAYEETDSEQKFEKISEPKFEILNGMDFLVSDNVTAVVAWNKLYHRSLFENIRYLIGRIHEDEFTTYKILYRAGDIAFCSERLYKYFVNPMGITKGDYSPKHLDMLDAFEERISFLEEKGERMCLRHTIILLLCMTAVQYHEYKDNTEYNYACKEVSARMRKYLKLYANILGISKKTNPHYYDIAYPKRAVALYYGSLVIKKTKEIMHIR